MPFRSVVMRLGHRGIRLWWRLRKPTTFGVKALLIHPDDPGRCLVVRHSYADQEWWALPGGGYNPKRETAEGAAIREVAEELSLSITEQPVVLQTLTTTREGKVDNLTIVLARPTSDHFELSPELTEARWVSTDPDALPTDGPVSRWLRIALACPRTAR
ncbi:NUDIX domain-containing protein [Kribbella monticola]|uniref:NUDIX domain-containing protein n=1 Tax=Kribbella monticola TaxID=2185285 RepID=UPI0018E551FF|nr:NUDIX domain-containing protein [Kribbella monticola]